MNTKKLNAKFAAVLISGVLFGTGALLGDIKTDPVYASAEDKLVNAGDTYNVKGNVFSATNHGTIKVNPSSGGVILNSGSEGELQTGIFNAVDVETQGSVDLGSGSQVNLYTASGSSNAALYANSGTISAVSGLKVYVTNGRGVHVAGTGDVNLGTGAEINVGTGDGIYMQTGTFAASDSDINVSNGSGLRLEFDAVATITNTNINATHAFSFRSRNSSDNIMARAVMDGGTARSTGDAITSIQGTGTYGAAGSVQLKNGAKLSSDNGVIASDAGISGLTRVGIIVHGNGTEISGNIYNNNYQSFGINLRLESGGKWITKGSSILNTFEMTDGGVVNFTMTAKSDKITVDDFSRIGSNTIEVELDDAFVGELMEIGGEHSLDATIILNGDLSGDGNITYEIATRSENYEWDVLWQNEGEFIIGNIREIPEASTFAAIAGLLALFIALRRSR